MRKTAAFLYASLTYAAIGTGIWWLFDKATVIAEEFQSTEVTLVSPEESFEDARQQVNSEASEASKAEEKPPEEVKPEEPEPEPKPEPEPEPPEPPEPMVEETPPPDPREMEEVMPEDLEDPEAPDPIEKIEEPPPPKLKPLDPVDPKKLLDLKKCSKEPVKKVVKNHKKKKKKVVKRNKNRAPSRASARSRARRGGSVSASRLLAQIKRRIARNKSYPSVARRRRMQGAVRVSFTITRSGGVSGIRVSGPKIFAASAKSAVRRAFPVDVSKASFSLPRRMSVTLRYRLH
jgi:protein TonB